MNLIFDCYPCLLRQVLSTAGLCSLDENSTKEVVDFTMSQLMVTSQSDSPQHIIVRVNEFIHQHYFRHQELFDPYAGLKKKSNEAVLSRFEQLKAMVHTADNPLEYAVKLAAAGNIIDFGANDHTAIDIEDEIRRIPLLRFSHYAYTEFTETLAEARTLLYIGDNAGEIVFDRLLIGQIKQLYPDMEIVFATRSQPVINDVTPEDACAVGMESVARVISSGCRYPGVILEDTSGEFRRIYDDADLVLAKGQGNFEGLSAVEDNRLFLILRIKCKRVAKAVCASVGDLVFLQKGLS